MWETRLLKHLFAFNVIRAGKLLVDETKSGNIWLIDMQLGCAVLVFSNNFHMGKQRKHI